MDQQFLLDAFDPTGYADKVPKEVAYIKRNMHSKRFFIDPLTSAKIMGMFDDHPELYEVHRRFAKPPFESCFVQFQAPEGYEGHHGVLWAEGRTVLFVPGHHPRQVVISRLTCDVLEGGLLVRDQRPGMITEEQDERKEQLTKVMVMFTAMVEILWLLMHRPGMVKVQQVPGKQKVIRGKLRPMRAHSVLTIDLAAKDLARTVIGDGRKGSGVREHEVRGTWVHLKHDRSCEHQWSKVDRAPLEPDTFQCPCCGTKRVWRKDHVRGEHSRGNKFNTYQVVDSRL